MAIDDSWMVAGLCRQVRDPDPIFFPPTHKGKSPDLRRAKQICSDCPVRRTCLAYAIAHNESRGVWGGYSEHERRMIPRRVKVELKVMWFDLHPLAKRNRYSVGR